MRSANDFELALSAAYTCLINKKAAYEAAIKEWRKAYHAGNEELADRLWDELDAVEDAMSAASKAYYEGVALL